MSEFDARTERALELLRARSSPPAGVEDGMLADFHATLDGGGPDGGGGEGGPTGGGGQLVYAAKIAGAVSGLTAAGFGALWLVASLVRGPASPPPKPDARPGAVQAAAPARLEGADHRPAPAVAPTPAPEAVSPAPAPAAPAPTPAAPSKLASRPAASASPEPSPTSTLAAELALIHAARDATPERLLAARPSPQVLARVRAACAEFFDLPTTGLGGPGDGSP